MGDFNKQRLLADIKKIRGTQYGLGFNIGKVINEVTGVVQNIADTWKSITSAFKTINTTTFKEKINGAGFSSYLSRSRFIRSIGIPTDKWNIYKPAFMRLTG